MATKAVVIQYANANTVSNGSGGFDFVFDLQILLADSAAGKAASPTVLGVSVPADDFAAWEGIIKTAVREMAVMYGLNAPALNAIVMPKFAP